MDFDTAIRLTEIILGFALLQQSAEHLKTHPKLRLTYITQAIFCLCLFMGLYTPWVCVGLFGLAIYRLHRFQGPYNGGSDRMGILIILCLCGVQHAPNPQWQEYIFAYLAAQLTLSYFISGAVKIVQPTWRNGQALRGVFSFSAYPVSQSLRGWANHPRLLWAMSWAVMVFEVLFPLSLISQPTLIIALVIAAIFHLANAFLFGLNRFFWMWLAAYPSILWLQERLFA